MTHFRDLAARCVFEARHVSRRGRPFDVFATWVCVARIRATNPRMNATMIVNLAT